ncbi:MAG: type II secretion system protein N [Gammaproteobacteria bacterium]|nr:type II secretion system protein N [Gammaproteobacteria bacterium]
MKMNPKLIALGVIAFFVFLIATAPASIITGMVSRQAAVEFEAISGTVWHGQADKVVARGIVIGPVEWNLHPWYLLRGELAATLIIHNSAVTDDVSGSLWLAAGLPGVLKIRDADVSIDASWASTRAAIPIAARGKMLIKIDRLQIRRDTLPEISATVSWQNAGVSFPQNYGLGTYNIEIQHEPADKPERVVANISDQDSLLHITGQAQFNQSGQYELDIRLSADATAPADIARVLPLLGTPADDGSVHIQRNGLLSDFL